MFSDLFFKTLKGSNGWSRLNLNKLDVTKIKSFNYSKRLFMIFDRDKPYTLIIEYYYPKDELKINPIISPNGGFVITHSVENDHFITKRYSTEKEIMDEMDEIHELQYTIERLKKIHVNELLRKL